MNTPSSHFLSQTLKHKAELFFITLCLMFCQSINAKESASLELTYKNSAQKIRANYDSNFIRLSQGARNHYAPRMYRLTGEYYYAQQSGSEIYQISDRLNNYLKNIDSPSWRLLQAEQMISRLPKTKRGKRRTKALKDTQDKRFALYLIYQMAKLKEYGLTHPGHEKFIKYLKQSNLNELLMSKDFIHAYAAQVANYVYWLKYLNIVDWTDQLQGAFARAYPDSKDAKLTKSAFNNKLYGLTHIVLADSNYYQQYVDVQKHQWILDYFDKNAERILSKSKEDIQAEVGLCFLLTQQYQSKTLAQMRAKINASISPNYEMIPSVKGNPDLSLGEHRNVLAFALLNWPKKLHQGPFPLQDEKLKKSLPLMYQQ